MRAIRTEVQIILAGLVLALAAWWGCACTPLPVSPEMRCEYDPKCGATDFPPLTTAARDAGADR